MLIHLGDIGDVNTVAAAIQTQEGYYPGTVAYRNNNPGNLKYAGQRGAIGQDASGFAVFPDYNTGYNALVNQINLDASRGLSISQFMNKYAPASDANDPAGYAAKIASATGLTVNDSLSAALSADGGTSSLSDLLGSPADTSGVGTGEWWADVVPSSFSLSSLSLTSPVVLITGGVALLALFLFSRRGGG